MRYAALWQQVFQVVMCVLLAVLCATQSYVLPFGVFNEGVHLLAKGILMLSKCTLQQ